MRNTAVINVRTNARIKSQAQDIAEKLGLSLSAVINGYLRQIIRNKAISFRLDEEPSEYLIKSLEKSKKDIKEGFISPTFDNVKDADAWLDDPKAKYQNQLRKGV
ncbi:MAG: type II toxin-antitoxin system RelB/DinJ family antitoxin [Parcubacteria group bacterium]|nr:type II toxin-antitoxin system RelB/DinJ family antitoxin [Parcubacteria group bacterium]